MLFGHCPVIHILQAALTATKIATRRTVIHARLQQQNQDKQTQQMCRSAVYHWFQIAFIVPPLFPHRCNRESLPIMTSHSVGLCTEHKHLLINLDSCSKVVSPSTLMCPYVICCPITKCKPRVSFTSQLYAQRCKSQNSYSIHLQ